MFITEYFPVNSQQCCQYLEHHVYLKSLVQSDSLYRQMDSNHRHMPYESTTLPLSYIGIIIICHNLSSRYLVQHFYAFLTLSKEFSHYDTLFAHIWDTLGGEPVCNIMFCRRGGTRTHHLRCIRPML